MDPSSTYEYVVRPRRTRRVLIALGAYALYIPVALTVGTLLRQFNPTFLILAAAVLLLIVLLSWKYTAVEYEYSLTGGVMTLCRVYGSVKRRQIAEIPIKDASAIMPYEGEYIQKALAYAPERSLDLTADLQHPNVYCLLYETDEQRRGILYFEATEQALRILRYYNSATVVKSLANA